MPSRISAWAVYDVFTVANGEQVFLAVVSDTQWATFCDAFEFADLKSDPGLGSNNQRVQARAWLLPMLRERLAVKSAADISAIFERNGLPYAPITRPQDLFDDPHLRATGGLASVTLPDGRVTTTPLLPLALSGRRLPLRADPPRLGEHSDQLLAELGYDPTAVAALRAANVVGEIPGAAAGGAEPPGA
jgi:crotonobetainyl-CoA:carnitine CoA-transferase CaiB-like acyl-CoA transferase